MSTYGGDSWVPEAMHRKHQVDQLLGDVHQLDRYSNQWRHLSNGRFACLICPHHPVLDTFPMLIMHRKGAKHQAAAVKHEEKDLRLQNEIQKRIALEANKVTDTVRSSQNRQSTSQACAPLIQATRKCTAQALAMLDGSKVVCYPSRVGDVPNTKLIIDQGTPFLSPTSLQVSIPPVKVKPSSAHESGHQKVLGKRKAGQLESGPTVGIKEGQERRQERERLLRLREAGWRLDGNGKWFKDENVEFDSDEEAPADLT
ncbi:uncharacterized protein [Physcomitrium patens]|uniref:Sodium channel modifier 1 n=1 Tax=Physcomitrium patens TaxID=3218 RepID=A0A2K1K6U6_PHYPA|nr:sodium channel modifier 1-like [Physcomitrium patens]XP_024382015.1 sodium channel modifier 1-like [Physcomitrium patens]PNR49495.1 hypothetical protein PHYPA_011391 [Physcomitrium patens]|eukprot:XP_024382014.1 sodium channel modifier 1-like [Physcomitrella patens]